MFVSSPDVIVWQTGLKANYVSISVKYIRTRSCIMPFLTLAGTQGKMADMFSDLAKTFSIGSASESFKLKAVFGLSQRFIF